MYAPGRGPQLQPSADRLRRWRDQHHHPGDQHPVHQHQRPRRERRRLHGYTFRTSADNKVVTENGTFTKDQVSAPVLITSFGQSADVSMLDALMKKVGAEYTFDATASAEDAAGYKTIIIASGASSKGLGAAGISQEDEIARAEAIAQTAKDNDITVIVAHMGGAARRGTLSDQFSDLALGCADYIMVVEEGNDDGKFSDAATDAGIPITMLYTIADAVTPLQEIFGA